MTARPKRPRDDGKQASVSGSAERRHAEQEAVRRKKIVQDIADWRLARDVRAYVSEVQQIIADAGMQLTKGGSPEDELNWALAYADRIDPLSTWRADVKKAREEYPDLCRADSRELLGGEAVNVDDDADGQG